MESYSLKVSSLLYLQLCLILMISLVVSPSLGSFSVIDNKQPPHDIIVVYLHNLDNITFTLVQAVQSTSNVGWTSVGKDVLTQGPSLSSKQVGTFSSLDVEAGLGPAFSSMLIHSVINYDDGLFKGSIVLHGELDFNAEVGQVAVVGGTYDFGGIRGYAVRKLHSVVEVENTKDSIVEFTIHIFDRIKEW